MTNEEMCEDSIVDSNDSDTGNRSPNKSTSSYPLVISLLDDETDSESDEPHAQPANASETKIANLSVVTAAKRENADINSTEIVT